MEPARQDSTTRQAHFGLWDTICIIVGIIVGSGIFRTPGTIFGLTGGPVAALAVWVIGGLLAIVGAFCFAELASTYPRSGGEYVYLTRAFGSWAGFLFAWGQLLIIRTGASLVAMAYVFAEYTTRLAEIPRNSQQFALALPGLAVLVVCLLTLINVIGVRMGKWTQNTFTAAKILGLGVVLVAAFLYARSRSPAEEYVTHSGQITATGPGVVFLKPANSASGLTFPLAPEAKLTIDGRDKSQGGQSLQPDDLKGLEASVVVRAGNPTRAVQVKATKHSLFGALSLALIFVLWTYAGWHEAAYIVAEVRHPRRNVPLALVLGTATVIALYLAANAAYLVGLGYEDAADSKEVAADVLALAPWKFGEKAICILIMISSFGALNGIIFTSSRIFSEFGSDHILFAPLGRWSKRFGTPVVSLVIQGGISVITIFLVACFFTSQDSFEAVVKGTAPVFWLFFLLTGLALFALRRKDVAITRPFTAPLYPLTPLIYCAICGWMLYGSSKAAFEEGFSGLFVAITVAAVLAGVPLFWLSRRLGQTTTVKRDEEHKVPSAVGD